MSTARPGEPLTRLTAGQLVPFGGDRVATVTAELAAAFAPGDRVVIVHETGDLLHVPRAEHELAEVAVTSAFAAFEALRTIDAARVTEFFDRFATALADADIAAAIGESNAADV